MLPALLGYNTIPQALTTASFPTAFPNLQYPTIINPAPTVSALLRLTTFPSKRGAINWVNNVPLSATDAASTNGIIHHTAAVVVPPSQFLWDRINNDPDMTYFKAAIQRADSGTGTLQAALLNIGANLTVFVPTDSAMRAAITAQLDSRPYCAGLSAGHRSRYCCRFGRHAGRVYKSRRSKYLNTYRGKRYCCISYTWAHACLR